MTNGNDPINPCIMQRVGETDYRLSKPGDPKEWNVPVAGLTKREAFAMAAMQGIVAKQGLDSVILKNNAELSVKQADALIAALNQSSNQ